MSSLRLTTSLQQKMVLTPQLRQRIEMLQMTSLELAELIEQEMVSNPILEEVMPGDEIQEISSNILDQNATGQGEVFENGNVQTLGEGTTEEFNYQLNGDNSFDNEQSASSEYAEQSYEGGEDTA